MKKLLLLLILSLASTLQASTISLVFSQNTIFVGDTFTATVRLNNPFDNFSGDSILGFGFDATPPVVLTRNAPTATPDFQLFTSGNPDFIGGSSNLIDDAGQLFIDLVVLNFTATAAGTANLALTFTGAGPDYGISYLGGTDQPPLFSASITVNDAVPEPGTVLLISAGLFALAALRKRK